MASALRNRLVFKGLPQGSSASLQFSDPLLPVGVFLAGLVVNLSRPRFLHSKWRSRRRSLLPFVACRGRLSFLSTVLIQDGMLDHRGRHARGSSSPEKPGNGTEVNPRE